MNPEQLFKIHYDKMTQALQRRTPEDMLDIARALRQILVDGDRLLDVVNRERRLKIRFTVGMSVEERAEEMAELGIPSSSCRLHFLGMFPPNEPRKNIKIDNLLSFKVVKKGERCYSVREVIKTCCNCLGAVHYGPPEKDNDIETGIRSLGEIFEVEGVHGAFATLVIIGSIVVEGLQELRQQIE